MENCIDWQKSNLVPAIVQDIQNLKILMLAYVNRESFELSLQTGIAHYFSRSKNRIWKKGEQSGNTQIIKEIYVDCDSDAVLFLVNQNGVACHTGNPTCFFKKIDIQTLNVDANLENNIDIPYNVIDKLYHVLQSKKNKDINKSYTAFLYEKGQNTIGKKIVEEAAELTFAIKDNKEDEIIYECADLFYHTLVGLSYRDISPDRVMQELKKRFSMSGLEEKRNRNNRG